MITDGREDTFLDPAKINSYGDKHSLNSNDVINNYGDNRNLRLDPERQKNASDKDLKYILFWNEAYGSKVHVLLIKFWCWSFYIFRSMTWGLEDSHSMTISVQKLGALQLMTGEDTGFWLA